jgi:DNA polymerase-3 subunit delta
MAASDSTLNASTFLERKEPAELPSVVAAFGPDDFLRSKSLDHAMVLGRVDPATVRSFDGEETQWRDLHDELATRSLFDLDGRRVARLRNADSFVSKYRESLERWVERPSPGATLLLDVRTLPANTILSKKIKKVGWLIPTGEFKDSELAGWIVRWGKNQHGLSLSRPQANVLVERIGPVCGLIDCELAKLTLFADAKGAVSDARVDELVGGWRTQTVWKLAEFVADGKINEALAEIDNLIMAAQSPIGIAAQLSWSLRRYGVAARAIEQMERFGQRPDLPSALAKAGFKTFEIAEAEKRLRRIGRPRARELLSWLLDLELALKGSHSNDDRGRLALESLLLKLADHSTSSPRIAS